MNGNNHPRPTHAMGSGGPPGPVAPRYGSPQPAPAPQVPHAPQAAPFPQAPQAHQAHQAHQVPPAPQVASGRNDELIAGNKTMFEFTGDAAAGADRGRKGTFMGSTLDLSHTDERRESNLKSGPSGWLFMGVAVLLVGGAVAWIMTGSTTEATATDQESPAVAAVDQAAPTPAEGEAQAGVVDAAGSGSGGEGAGSSGAAEPAAEEPKPEEPKPEEPKAEEPKPEEPKAEPTSTKKPSTKKPSTKKPSTKKPSTKKPSSSKGKTLKPKKPPRDPLSNLPKPPGG